MTTEFMNRINHLSSERVLLYREAGGGRADSRVLSRIQQVNNELESLWEARRRERAGRREGIDLVVHRAYAETYGAQYEDAIAPPTVGEATNEPAEAAA